MTSAVLQRLGRRVDRDVAVVLLERTPRGHELVDVLALGEKSLAAFALVLLVDLSPGPRNLRVQGLLPLFGLHDGLRIVLSASPLLFPFLLGRLGLRLGIHPHAGLVGRNIVCRLSSFVGHAPHSCQLHATARVSLRPQPGSLRVKPGSLRVTSPLCTATERKSGTLSDTPPKGALADRCEVRCRRPSSCPRSNVSQAGFASP